MRGRVPHRVKRTTNFIPAGDTSFSSLFCYAHFQSRKFGGTFFVSAIDFCLQDSLHWLESANRCSLEKPHHCGFPLMQIAPGRRPAPAFPAPAGKAPRSVPDGRRLKSSPVPWRPPVPCHLPATSRPLPAGSGYASHRRGSERSSLPPAADAGETPRHFR